MPTITPRSEDYSKWYADVISAAELAEHGPTKGSMIIKPDGYALWEGIQRYLNGVFQVLGIRNAYFPMLIPERFIMKEAEHVQGFAPELATVTRAGTEVLDEPLVLRPTSETIIYDAFSRWIGSYADLPLLINQWANVIRWELRPRLFLRTSEFLWQEGHTVHASASEAETFARTMLDVYRDTAEELLAIPVIRGEKSPSERFAGAARTFTVEAMMQDGKALQFATSHDLGQKFAKTFDVTYASRENTSEYAWQTSWGLSTRSIGGLIMTHSDDKGLVLPPRIAPIQVVIMPVRRGGDDDAAVISAAIGLQNELASVGIRVHLDGRDKRQGEKHFQWEVKGIPVRLEIGPRDLLAGTAVMSVRTREAKESLGLAEAATRLPVLLEQIQADLLASARSRMLEMTVEVSAEADFRAAIADGRFVSCGWDGEAETEARIKEETKATLRCIPFDAASPRGSDPFSGLPAKFTALYAKAY